MLHIAVQFYSVLPSTYRTYVNFKAQTNSGLLYSNIRSALTKLVEQSV